MKSLRLLAPVLGSVLAIGLTAACGAHHAGTVTPPTTSSVGASSTPVSTPTTAPYTPPALSSPSSTGTLTLTAIATLPLSGVVSSATEAPDGTLFFAATATTVDVVDGVAEPAVSEHADAEITGLAADASSLFVATTRDLTRYDRTSGAVVRSWPLPIAHNAGGSLQDSGTRVWLLQGDRHLVEIDPDSPTTTTIATQATVPGLAVDATGAYYVTVGGATLVHVDLSGATKSAPTHETVDVALSGVDAVHPEAVVNGTLVVAHDAGQGTDSELVTYQASTLERLTGSGTTVGGSAVVSTLAGPLVAGAGLCAAASTSCVGRSVISSGQVSEVAMIPAGQNVIALAGPYPVIITIPSDNTLTETIYRLQ